jgi:hypothetical protein
MDRVGVEPTTSATGAQWLSKFEEERYYLLILFVDEVYAGIVVKLGSR